MKPRELQLNKLPKINDIEHYKTGDDRILSINHQNFFMQKQTYRDLTPNKRAHSPCRILHFVSSLSISSGVMAVIMNYYRNINRDNIQFDFIYYKDIAKDNTYGEEIDLLGGRAFLIDKPSLSFKYKKYLHNFFDMHKQEFAVIHIHEVYLTFMFAPIAKAHGLKIIIHCHSTRFSDHLLHAIRNRILCIGINRKADLKLACSKAAGIALYGKNVNFAVINNAIDLDKFAFSQNKRDALHRELNIENKIVIGHVGRFSREKNHKFLITIFYEFHKINRDSVLLLIGEGPLLEEVRRQVTALSLSDSVLFLGRRDDVQDLYNVMDIFVLPSLFEGLGIVSIEAQANGLPCVMASCIPQEAMIDKVTLVNLSRTPSCWCDQISNSLIYKRKKCSLEKFNFLGYNIKLVAKTLENKYISLIEQRIQDKS